MGNVEVVDRLLSDPRIDVCYGDNETTWYACWAGNADVVHRLLQDERVQESSKTRCMPLAVRRGRSKVLEKLIRDNRFSLLGDDLVRSVHTKDMEIVKLLLQDPRILGDKVALDNALKLAMDENF
jgi:hypothetical protein